MFERSRHFLDCHIAGLSHWDAAVVHEKLVPGAKLTLKPESDNPFDPNAIAVFCGSEKIGYIPKDRNVAISQLFFFGHGDIFEARVSQVDTTAPLEHQVHMTVLVKDAQK